MNDNYRKELVQVAAVCLAAAQCDAMDSTSLDATNEGVHGRLFLQDIQRDVFNERQMQELKWGACTKREAPPEFWLLVLLEEVGEVATEILEDRVCDREYAPLVLAAEKLGNEARAVLEAR